MADAGMDFTREEWADAVADVLAAHPDWAAATVQAMQAGILAANDRLRERTAVVSMGLVEALNTRPGAVKRNHGVIVAAIEASTVNRSKWSAEMIAKERA